MTRTSRPRNHAPQRDSSPPACATRNIHAMCTICKPSLAPRLPLPSRLHLLAGLLSPPQWKASVCIYGDHSNDIDIDIDGARSCCPDDARHCRTGSSVSARMRMCVAQSEARPMCRCKVCALCGAHRRPGPRGCLLAGRVAVGRGDGSPAGGVGAHVRPLCIRCDAKGRIPQLRPGGVLPTRN